MTLSHELTLQDILQVEDDIALVDFRCRETGVLLWPSIRNFFIRMIVSDLLYGTPLVGSDSSYVGNRMAVAKAVARASWHNVLRSGKAKGDILLMATGAGYVLKDGKYFNRLSDHFVGRFPGRTVVIEGLFNWHWPFPRHYQNVIFYTPIEARMALLGRFMASKCEKQAAQMIALVRHRARQLFGWDLGDAREAFLIRSLARSIATMPQRYRSYETLLMKVGAKIVIAEQGCYGRSACLISVARHLGITTAEHQHGMVTAGHDAYNLAPALRDNQEYKKTLPDYFLGYGKWWCDQINVPVNKIALGNPHRTEKLASRSDRPRQKTDILILSDGMQTDLYLELARKLSCQNGTPYRVRFRPNPTVPMERVSVIARFPDENADGFQIDSNDDIYDSFATAHAVISEISTGLSEAVGIVENVFLWDTAKARFNYPSHPFTTFIDAADLLSKISDERNGRVDHSMIDSIWAPQWQANYDRFIDDVIS